MFLLWFYLSSSYSVSVLYAESKMVYLAYNTVLPIMIIALANWLFPNGPIDIKFLVRLTFISSIIILLLLLVFGGASETGRVSVAGVDNPIWISRFFGMNLLIMLLGHDWGRKKLVFILSVVACLWGLILSGSRTPLIALVAVLSIYMVRRYNFTLVFCFLLFMIGVYLLGVAFSNNYIFDVNFYSVYHRIEYFTKAIATNWDPLIGFGLGAFGPVILGEDVMFYPHNLVIEIIFEMGLIGGALFFILFILFVRKFSGSIFDYLFIYYLMLSMASGDMPGNNFVFILFFCSYIFKSGTVLESKNAR